MLSKENMIDDKTPHLRQESEDALPCLSGLAGRGRGAEAAGRLGCRIVDCKPGQESRIPGRTGLSDFGGCIWHLHGTQFRVPTLVVDPSMASYPGTYPFQGQDYH